MTVEDWKRVADAVAGALELQPGERDEHLHSLLEGRKDLIDEAKSLLALEQDDQPDLVVHIKDEDWLGRSIGPYCIDAKAGEGGMGVVWSASRSDGQFERRVAIKFLAGVFPSAKEIERFLSERAILARLDHPNIASLLDAGAVGQRIPYLVMEWVEGKRIDEYARNENLSVAKVVALFRKVCGAVEYAHRQLIVHRDLKPSNIYVTSTGQVKLLDFGIAKLVGPTEAGDATATLQRLLTVEYASPEQLRGEPATTSVDVYSLGVVLYELLAGRRPISLAGKTLGEIVDGAGHIVPPKPSSIRSNVPRELDAVVAQAMAGAPAERYGSVAELSADLDRYLTGRPVLARRSSSFYIAAKFARRHWRSVSAAALALILIGASAVVATIQRNKARQRFAQLQQLSNAVIFEFEDGIRRLPGTLEVRRKMVKRSLEFLDSLNADAHDDPRLLSDLARGYWHLATVQGKPSEANLGDFPGALASGRKAENALDALLRLRPNDFDALCDRADVITLISQIQQRVPKEDYLSTKREGIRSWEEIGRTYPARERALSGWASALFYKADYAGALTIYERLGQRNPAYQRNVALLCRMIASEKEKDFGQALPLIDRATEIDRGRVAKTPLDRGARLDLSFDLAERGRIDRLRGDLTSTIRFFEEVAVIRENLVREEPSDEQAKDRLLYAWCELAGWQEENKDRVVAVRNYRRAVALSQEMSTEARPNVQFEKLRRTAREGLKRLGG